MCRTYQISPTRAKGWHQGAQKTHHDLQVVVRRCPIECRTHTPAPKKSHDAGRRSEIVIDLERVEHTLELLVGSIVNLEATRAVSILE